jgi:hypothetical protein
MPRKAVNWRQSPELTVAASDAITASGTASGSKI